jgi:molecular chaperone IbpA
MEDMAMRSAFDFSPLYRSTVGFDRLFDMLDQAVDVEPMPSWPSYNVEKVGEDRYRVVMAVAGFTPDEIEIVQKDSALFVAGGNSPRTRRCKFCIGGSWIVRFGSLSTSPTM